MSIQEMNNGSFVEWLGTVEPDTNSLITNRSYADRFLCCFKRVIELQLADDQPMLFNRTRLQEFFNRERGETVQVTELDQEGLVQEFQGIYDKDRPAIAVPIQEPAHVPTIHNSLAPSRAATHSTVVRQAQKVRLPKDALEWKKIKILWNQHRKAYQDVCNEKSAKEARLASRIILSRIVGEEVVDFQYKTFDFLLRVTVAHQVRKLPERQRYVDMVETLLNIGK